MMKGEQAGLPANLCLAACGGLAGGGKLRASPCLLQQEAGVFVFRLWSRMKSEGRLIVEVVG